MTYFAERKLPQKQIQPIKPSTAAEYDRAWTRLNGQHWRNYADIHQIKSKSSLAVLRAAWRRGIAQQILNGIESTHNDRDQSIQTLYTQLDDDIRGVGYIPAADSSHTSKGRKHSSRKTSKRQSLNGLPDNWRSQLIRAMNTKEDQLALMVMSLTGARPEELRMGVQLVIETDQRLTFRIQGAKVSTITGGGQAWRELTVDAWRVLDNDLVYELLVYIQEHQITTIQIDPKNAFQKRLQRIRNKMAQYNPEWSKVSAYSFRHQFAADLKAGTTISLDNISAAMGHTSDRTKQCYGHSSQKRGKGGITQITAASPIKVHRKSAASQVFLSKAAKRSKNQKTEAALKQK
ncbi:MAG: tyrosine-type recombinase/integrase [Atribacterota bacterium]|jgi:integrase|nr:tyrosine-type recombinase/integrase [Atribacterota bacterium]